MPDLTKYVAANLERIRQARRIADRLRHDERLHRLAMQAVFLLEDCYEVWLDTEQRAEAGDHDGARLVEREPRGSGSHFGKIDALRGSVTVTAMIAVSGNVPSLSALNRQNFKASGDPRW